jgi:hypothetical protein
MAGDGFTTADINKMARSLEGPAYIAVGLGVLGFQRAQVLRRAAQEQVQHLGRDLDQRTASLRRTAADTAGEAAQHLPEAARDLLGAAANLVTELPSEARALAREVAALGRFAMHAAGAPAARYASRQGA